MKPNFIINDFEGPLDLLLHLVKESKKDIYDINIISLTDQYIDFINAMDGLNIDVASEYIVMAGELLHLKSRVLLNQDVLEEENEYEITSVDELQRRISEYEKYRNVTSDLKQLEEKRSEVYTKIPSLLSDYMDESTVINSDVTVNDLLDAFSLFLERQKQSQPLNTKIVEKEYSVAARCESIRQILNVKKSINFTELFDIITKEYVIVTFLSILEMAKNDELLLIQEKNFGSITIEMK